MTVSPNQIIIIIIIALIKIFYNRYITSNVVPVSGVASQKRNGWVRKVGLPQPLRGRSLGRGLEKMKPILSSFHAI